MKKEIKKKVNDCKKSQIREIKKQIKILKKARKQRENVKPLHLRNSKENMEIVKIDTDIAKLNRGLQLLQTKKKDLEK